MIKQCTCKNEYQDKRYGKQMRVHTLGGKKDDEARCTVCHVGGIFKRMASIANAWKPIHSGVKI